MLLLAISMDAASPPQSRKSARKPAKKEATGRCGIRMLTTNAATEMVHQGRKSPPIKLNRAISRIDTKNFIMTGHF
jgi:hypothetical protein